MRKKRLILGGLFWAIFGSFWMDAGVKTTTMRVSGVLAIPVVVTANDLDFGTVSETGLTLMTASLSIRAGSSTIYRITIDAGRYAIGTSRYLAMGSNRLAYALYKDAPRTLHWGDSDFANTFPVGSANGSFTGTGSAQTYTVYGQCAAAPTAPAGSYEDTLTVTVHY